VNSETTVQNSYLRRFLLNTDYGVSRAFTVTTVNIGVESAVAGQGLTQPVVVNLYTIPVGGSLIYANLTLIGTRTFDMPNSALTIVDIPVAGLLVQFSDDDLHANFQQPFGDGLPDSLTSSGNYRHSSFMNH
jgi:hypothetical protein